VTDVDMFVALFGSWLVLVLVVLLSGLREPWFWKLGEKVMSVIDEAIARFTAFTQGVLAQLKGAKDSNDAQTGKLAELQTALDAALADDNADKAAIAALQAEVNTLQESVAAQINAAVDALQSPPADVTPVEPTPVEPTPVEEVTPVEEATPVEDPAPVDTPPVA
jgi:hypothetical protein